MSESCAFMPLAQSAWDWFAPPEATLLVALALLVAVVIALISKSIPFLPLVTAYILSGILIGPYVARLITEPQVRQLQPLRDMALAVILFTIGTRFELPVFRRLWRWLAVWGAWDIGVMLVVVGVPMLLITRVTLGGWNVEWALLIAIIAMEIAPAATFLVLRETASSGPLTRLVLNAVVINNIIVIAIFSLVYPVLQVVVHGQPIGVLAHGPGVIFGSLGLGLVIGLVTSFAEQKYESDSERLLLLLAAILLTLGLSRMFNFNPFLITPLAAGIVIGNSSGKVEHVRAIIERIDTPFYVIFFVLAGASLHLDYLLDPKWAIIAAAYIVLRSLARIAAGWLGSHGRSLEPRVKRWFPLALLSHSAIAIALVDLLQRQHEGDPQFVSLGVVVLAAVAIYEIAAPILLKLAVTVVGEVSVAHHLRRGVGLADLSAWRQVFNRLAGAIGLSAVRRAGTLAQANLEQLIIRDVQALHIDNNYAKVLGFVGHSKYDCFPVVDEDGYYVGYISYFHVQDISFDPALSDLIIARDMMVSGTELHLDRDSPQDMADKFAKANTSYLPVVRPAKDDGKRLTLVGVMRSRSLMRYVLAESEAVKQVRREETAAAVAVDAQAESDQQAESDEQPESDEQTPPADKPAE